MLVSKDNINGILAPIGNTNLLKLEKNFPERGLYINTNENESNFKDQRLVAEELLDQLGNNLDYLFVGRGTPGTIMGCLREIQPGDLETFIVPVDGMGSKIFNSPNKKIPRIGASQNSKFILPEYLHSPVYVDHREGVIGCSKINKERSHYGRRLYSSPIGSDQQKDSLFNFRHYWAVAEYNLQ